MHKIKEGEIVHTGLERVGFESQPWQCRCPASLPDGIGTATQRKNFPALVVRA